MGYKYFSKNGHLLPIEQAAVALNNIAYAYGFGVYESLRVDKNIIYFIDDHLERLQESARIIGLEHAFDSALINDSVSELLAANKVETCNIKLLLIGGQTKSDAELYALCLNPLFPDRKLYKDGAKTTVYKAERLFPQAKSLNMLQSYIAYTKARTQGAYDALLINNDNHITEGTRTNFFCIKGRTIISPPKDDILLGVMRKVVLRVACENNFAIEYRNILFDDLAKYDNAFLTSTSSKIMPVKSIGSYEFPAISLELIELLKNVNEFLKNSDGKLS